MQKSINNSRTVMNMIRLTRKMNLIKQLVVECLEQKHASLFLTFASNFKEEVAKPMIKLTNMITEIKQPINSRITFSSLTLGITIVTITFHKYKQSQYSPEIAFIK